MAIIVRVTIEQIELKNGEQVSEWHKQTILTGELTQKKREQLVNGLIKKYNLESEY